VSRLVESVPNVSEGRRLDVVERLAGAMGLAHVPPRETVVMRLPPPGTDSERIFAAAVGRGVLPTNAHAAP